MTPKPARRLAGEGVVDKNDQKQISQEVGTDPEWGKLTCELTLKGMSVEELRNLIRGVEDGHVMLDTVENKDEYTGERKYILD